MLGRKQSLVINTSTPVCTHHTDRRTHVHAHHADRRTRVCTPRRQAHTCTHHVDRHTRVCTSRRQAHVCAHHRDRHTCVHTPQRQAHVCAHTTQTGALLQVPKRALCSSASNVSFQAWGKFLHSVNLLSSNQQGSPTHPHFFGLGCSWELSFFFLFFLNHSLFLFFYFIIYLFIYFFISWRLITLQYCSGFCHTLK